MKRFSISCVIIITLSTVASFILSYAQGRAGRWFSVFGFPAGIIPLLMNISCLIVLCVLSLVALVKRQQARLALAALSISTLLVVTEFIVSPARVFQFGFRQRIQGTLSAEELRQIARVCHDTLPIDGMLPGPEKHSLWTEQEHRPIWVTLTNSSSLGKLDPSMVIFNRSDAVELSWGGALVGHWGVRIQNEPVTNAGDIGPGITTFVSD